MPYTTLYKPLQGVLYNIFEAWLLSFQPLPSRQVNMADSCEWFFLFIYLEDITVSPGYLKGWRIFKRLLSPLGQKKKTFKNSYSTQLRIVNAVAS